MLRTQAQSSALSVFCEMFSALWEKSWASLLYNVVSSCNFFCLSTTWYLHTWLCYTGPMLVHLQLSILWLMIVIINDIFCWGHEINIQILKMHKESQKLSSNHKKYQLYAFRLKIQINKPPTSKQLTITLFPSCLNRSRVQSALHTEPLLPGELWLDFHRLKQSQSKIENQLTLIKFVVMIKVASAKFVDLDLWLISSKGWWCFPE